MKTSGTVQVSFDRKGQPWLIVGTDDGYEAHEIQVVSCREFKRKWQAIEFVHAQTAGRPPLPLLTSDGGL